MLRIQRAIRKELIWLLTSVHPEPKLRKTLKIKFKNVMMDVSMARDKRALRV